MSKKTLGKFFAAALVSLSSPYLFATFNDCAGLTAMARKEITKGNYKAAKSLCIRAAKAARGANEICDSSIALGKYYIAIKNYPAAEKAFNKLLNIKDMARKEHCFKLYKELINLHSLTGNKTAQEKYMKEIVLYTGDTITQVLRDGTAAYHAKEYALAEALLLKAASIGGSLSSTAVINTWKTLARNAFESGNPKKAYDYLKEFQSKEKCSGYPFEEMERVRWEILYSQKRYKEALDAALKLATTTQISYFKAEGFSRAAKIMFYHFKDVKKAKEYIDKSVAAKDNSGLDKNLLTAVNNALKGK